MTRATLSEVSRLSSHGINPEEMSVDNALIQVYFAR